jgi:N-methylhydantoinase A
LVTTQGFRDMLEIGRAGRPVAFDLAYTRETPLIPRNLRFEILERIDARGQIVTPLARDQLETLAQTLIGANVESIAVSLLNSYSQSAHEFEIARFLRERLPHTYVSAGCELSREWYEYERTSTAAANAYIGPRTVGYVDRFDKRLGEERFPGLFYMMGSNGGVLPVARAREQPIALIESGPIGGCVGASVYSKGSRPRSPDRIRHGAALRQMCAGWRADTSRSKHLITLAV